MSERLKPQLSENVSEAPMYSLARCFDRILNSNLAAYAGDMTALGHIASSLSVMVMPTDHPGCFTITLIAKDLRTKEER